MPVSMVEFGTPMDCTFRRGRHGFESNITSEPLLTEFAAIYFGKDAYAAEEPKYRQFLHDLFRGGMLYRSSENRLDEYANNHKVQQLFRINTWRSWRTAGLPGGLHINTSTGAITGTVAVGAAEDGPYTVTVTANDGTYSASQTYAWDVTNPIAIVQPPDQSNTEGDTVSLALSTSYTGSGTLVYGATGLPPGPASTGASPGAAWSSALPERIVGNSLISFSADIFASSVEIFASRPDRERSVSMAASKYPERTRLA